VKTLLEGIDRANRLWSDEYERRKVDVPNLYHYTTVDGLRGILSSGSIYASHVLYLNDSSEVKHALDFASNCLAQIEKSAIEVHGVPAKRLCDYGHFFFKGAKILWDEDVYVTSFCEEGDLLSQWRGYAMGGFAILFAPLLSDRKFLVWGDGATKSTIAKVMYGDAEKKEALTRILAAGVKATAKAGDRELETTLATVTSGQLQTWIHTAKDKSFEHEQEWRIISLVEARNQPLKASDGFETRIVSGQLVPAIRLRPNEQKLLPILGVKCGPNESQELTEKAVTLLLASYGYPIDQVSSSRVPFRSRY